MLKPVDIGRWVKRKVKPVPKSMPVTMYDSVTVSEIPANAKAVAGYVNGIWPTFPTLVKNFPHAYRFSVAVNAAHDADCLDIERGDASPEDAPAWIRRQMKRGIQRPAVYCSVSDASTVLRRLQAAGLKRKQFRLWTAHYTGTPHRCSHVCYPTFTDQADATQYTDKALGRNLDASLCGYGFFS